MWAEARGERVVAIVHSHPDGEAVFSDEDIAGALMPRRGVDDPVEPRYPGVDYLIVSIRGGEVCGATLFYFDPNRREFLPRWRLDKSAFIGKEVGGGFEA